MRNNLTASDSGALFLVGALLFGLLWRYSHALAQPSLFLLAVIVIVLAVSLVVTLLSVILLRRRRLSQIELKPHQWANMSGARFEDQMVIWLKNQDYAPVVKTEYYDQGIDILATKATVSYGIQVKRSSRRVGVAAVRAAVAGLNSYGCDQAMVLTNSTFTNQARSLARANNCLLIDGSELLRYAK